MKTRLIIGIEVDGFHRWPDAPDKYIEFRNKHRHLFKIICYIPLENSADPNRRQKELWEERFIINSWINDHYGNPAQFNDMSCEGLSELLLQQFKLSKCYVFEDTLIGAVSYA